MPLSEIHYWMSLCFQYVLKQSLNLGSWCTQKIIQNNKILYLLSMSIKYVWVIVHHMQNIPPVSICHLSAHSCIFFMSVFSPNINFLLHYQNVYIHDHITIRWLCTANKSFSVSSEDTILHMSVYYLHIKAETEQKTKSENWRTVYVQNILP